jgi:hypothetical protein
VASIVATNLYGPLPFFIQEPLCGSPLILKDVGTASLPFPGLNSHRIVPEVALGSHVVFGHPWPPQMSVPSANAGDAPVKAHRPAIVKSSVMTFGLRILSLPKRCLLSSLRGGFHSSAVDVCMMGPGCARRLSWGVSPPKRRRPPPVESGALSSTPTRGGVSLELSDQRASPAIPHESSPTARTGRGVPKRITAEQDFRLLRGPYPHPAARAP